MIDLATLIDISAITVTWVEAETKDEPDKHCHIGCDGCKKSFCNKKDGLRMRCGFYAKGIKYCPTCKKAPCPDCIKRISLIRDFGRMFKFWRGKCKMCLR